MASPRGLNQVAYVDFGGEGALTFVCVPGLGDLADEYRAIAPKLSALGRVLCMDLRGLGGSDFGFPSYEPHDTGSDIEALLEQLDIKRAVLVCCSMAGASAVWAATGPASASRVVGVVFINPFAWDHPMPCGLSTALWLLLNRWTGP